MTENPPPYQRIHNLTIRMKFRRGSMRFVLPRARPSALMLAQANVPAVGQHLPGGGRRANSHRVWRDGAC
jgi:hypothetical protein